MRHVGHTPIEESGKFRLIPKSLSPSICGWDPQRTEKCGQDSTHRFFLKLFHRIASLSSSSLKPSPTPAGLQIQTRVGQHIPRRGQRAHRFPTMSSRSVMVCGKIDGGWPRGKENFVSENCHDSDAFPDIVASVIKHRDEPNFNCLRQRKKRTEILSEISPVHPTDPRDGKRTNLQRGENCSQILSSREWPIIPSRNALPTDGKPQASKRS